jgi:aminomethyltransferase
VPFAGYEMPLNYPLGIVAEHLQVRKSAGLFDVSHMGQATLRGPDFETVARALEALTPGDMLTLRPGALRYSLLLNERGGIIDDLMVARPPENAGADSSTTLSLVVNASRKQVDYAHVAAHLPAGVTLEPRPDLALMALQGPSAASILSQFIPGADRLSFMSSAQGLLGGVPVGFSRSGYTGEDGYEISVPAGQAIDVARALLADDRVLPIGLGARDTLRLEAGLCLYGQDMDEDTSPIEAGLGFSIGKRRRREGGFPGAERIQRERASGPVRLRAGLVLEGRAAARHGVELREPGRGEIIGRVTSGAFTPSAAKSIAMGYLPPRLANPGAEVEAIIRGAPQRARVVALPFVPHRYFRPATPAQAS